MRMPLPEERVLLLCTNCHHSFMGPCSNRYGIFYFINRIYNNQKCPKCGKNKVILNPIVRY